ncbi:MAG: tRNA lysidine(34) synthetase TilS [Bacteroidales bacterium]|nr:tRNA lysidine(34) synthetase TilS [Bacteroidales bacterium]
MLERFRQHIERQHLFSDREEVLLAVSGGRDSVTLADLMHRCGIHFSIAHCNFHLRPGDCDRDQHFVQELAQRMGVEFFSSDFDTKRYAEQNTLSVEEAARVLRYNWFAELCRECHFGCLTTAHHRDDSVETFFLNLFRGTGINGLHGIRPETTIAYNGFSMRVVRPLLCFSRAEIDEYITARGLEYVDDYTNDLLDARRNRIRLQLMPLLRNLYPSVDDTIQADIERLHEAGLVVNDYVSKLRLQMVGNYEKRLKTFPFDIHAVDVAAIKTLNPQRTLLFELLKPYGFNSSTVDDILQSIFSGHTGRQFLSSDYVVELHRNQLLIAPKISRTAPKIESSLVERESGCRLPLVEEKHKGMVEFIDADKVCMPISVRPWNNGDRFCPLGMAGTRLVSDFLKDCGLSLIERRQTYILVDASDNPLWVIGLRIDNRYRITDTTKNVLRIASRIENQYVVV